MTGLLLLGACTGDARDTTSTAATTTSAVTTTEAARPTSTTTPLPLAPTLDASFLVRGGDGVWQVGPGGAVEQLIEGLVGVAVDDTRGGLLYQLDSGRVLDEAEPGFATASGLEVGDVVSDLASSGDDVRFPDRCEEECNEGRVFWIGPPPTPGDSMNGGLDGDPDDPATRITYLHAGAHSSC